MQNTLRWFVIEPTCLGVRRDAVEVGVGVNDAGTASSGPR